MTVLLNPSNDLARQGCPFDASSKFMIGSYTTKYVTGQTRLLPQRPATFLRIGRRECYGCGNRECSRKGRCEEPR